MSWETCEPKSSMRMRSVMRLDSRSGPGSQRLRGAPLAPASDRREACGLAPPRALGRPFAMAVRWLQFFTIVVCALALIPSGAHLAALPNKIDLPQGDYFIV